MLSLAGYPADWSGSVVLQPVRAYRELSNASIARHRLTCRIHPWCDLKARPHQSGQLPDGSPLAEPGLPFKRWQVETRDAHLALRRGPNEPRTLCDAQRMRNNVQNVVDKRYGNEPHAGNEGGIGNRAFTGIELLTINAGSAPTATYS